MQVMQERESLYLLVKLDNGRCTDEKCPICDAFITKEVNINKIYFPLKYNYFISWKTTKDSRTFKA